MKRPSLTENLIYRVPLDKVMEMILPFYWKSPKHVLDVTTGGKSSWSRFINEVGLDGITHWKVTFLDIAPEAKPDAVADCRILPFKDDAFDIVYYDPPFTKPENDSVKMYYLRKGIKKSMHREYLMRNFIELKRMFNETVEEFNRVATEGLVIKIGDRHEEKEYIAQHIDAFLAYSKKFKLIDILHYRGARHVIGAYLPFASNTITYYLIFKKNVHRK